jgi:hypothetical protein
MQRQADQHAVAGGLDDPATMRGDGGIDEAFSVGLEPGQRASSSTPWLAL